MRGSPSSARLQHQVAQPQRRSNHRGQHRTRLGSQRTRREQAAVNVYIQQRRTRPSTSSSAPAGEALNAGLISDGALDFQVRQRLAAAARPTHRSTVILSPAPLFGHWLVEVAQKAKTLWTVTPNSPRRAGGSVNVRATTAPCVPSPHSDRQSSSPETSTTPTTWPTTFSVVRTRRPLRPADVVGGQERDGHHDETRRHRLVQR